MSESYYAGGFLFQPDARKVLLHRRGADALMSPGVWAFFGGENEEEDEGDPVRTWRREMREELGIALDAEQISIICEGVHRHTGQTRHFLYAEWPALSDDFVLGEGAGFAWFPLDEAVRESSLPTPMRRCLESFAEVVNAHISALACELGDRRFSSTSLFSGSKKKPPA